MLILRLATNVRLIDLDRSEHQPVLVVGEDGSDAMSQVSSGFPTDTEVSCQLVAGHPSRAREYQINGADLDRTTQG